MDRDKQILIDAITELLSTTKYETLRTVYLLLVRSKQKNIGTV